MYRLNQHYILRFILIKQTLLYFGVLQPGNNLSGGAVQFATRDQKNATNTISKIYSNFLTLKYAITLYFSHQFLQSWNFLLCKILKVFPGYNPNARKLQPAKRL